MTIAITMGDSSGVGPEIILHAFKKNELPQDFVIVGDYGVLNVCNRLLKYEVPLRLSNGRQDLLLLLGAESAVLASVRIQSSDSDSAGGP